MRGKLIIAAILAQFLILGWIGGKREWIVRTGPRVWLRTAPIDPRDLFRGDYVTLGYDISSIPEAKFGPGLKKYMADITEERKNDHYRDTHEIGIYAALSIDPQTNLAEIASVDLSPPSIGPFIKGQVPYWHVTPMLTGVTYGIDAYFVQQGSGHQLERRAPDGLPDGVQVPMEMQVALGDDGTAVLTDHRWFPLGMDFQISKRGDPNSNASTNHRDTKTPKVIRVTLCNASKDPLAVVLPADLRTLHIELEGNNDQGIAEQHTSSQPLTDADVRMLQPGETTTIEIDPLLPQWFVKSKDGKIAQPIWKDNDQYGSYRMIYQAPTPEECRGLSKVKLITQGQLISRQFSNYELQE